MNGYPSFCPRIGLVAPSPDDSLVTNQTQAIKLPKTTMTQFTDGAPILLPGFAIIW